MPTVLTDAATLRGASDTALTAKLEPEIDALLAHFDKTANAAAEQARTRIRWTYRREVLQAVRDGFEAALTAAGFTLDAPVDDAPALWISWAATPEAPAQPESPGQPE